MRFSQRSFLPSRLFTPLYTSFLFLVLLGLFQGGASFLLETHQQRVVTQITRSLQIEREAERLLSAALDEQTSLRGYLLTQDVSFLEPYRIRAQTTFYESFDQLCSLLIEEPEQTQRLIQIKAIYENWQFQFARKVINGTASRTTLPGKVLFDPMRSHLNALLDREDRVLSQQRQQLRQLNQSKAILDVGNFILILLGVGWNLWLLRRRVERPLRQLTEVSHAWRSGNLEARLNYSSSDEIGQLIKVLDSMASEIRDRQESSKIRNRQLEDLISALSHDLRTPLLATRTTLRPMLSGAFGSVNDTWREVLEEYSRSNEHLLKLVDTLLDVSRYEAEGSQNLICEILDWEQIFTRATAQVRASLQQPCDFVVSIDPALPPVYGDPIEIQRVIQNLLDNAARVSPPNRSVMLQATGYGTQQVRITVRDFGPGVTPQEQKRLFHRFMQGRGRRGGAGLGLYLCRQIIKAHGGTIGVDSTPGEGSTFWFTLWAAMNNRLQQSLSDS